MSLNEIELDRLADYTVELLDPQDAAEVRRLIGTDERWAQAYEALVGADALVRADLATAARADATMPADVVARIDAALQTSSVPSAPAKVISLDAARARRRTMYTWLAASAAAVVLLAGLGLAGSYLQSSTRPEAAPAFATGGNADSARAGAPVAPPTALAGPAGAVVVSSGVNYVTETLTQVLNSSPAAVANSSDVSGGKASLPQAAREAVPSALTRLTDSRALQACLAAVLGAHPGTVRVVDFARYADKPALIIGIVPATTGSFVAVAVGELCGLTGPDELAFSAR